MGPYCPSKFQERVLSFATADNVTAFCIQYTNIANGITVHLVRTWTSRQPLLNFISDSEAYFICKLAS